MILHPLELNTRFAYDGHTLRFRLGAPRGSGRKGCADCSVLLAGRVGTMERIPKQPYAGHERPADPTARSSSSSSAASPSSSRAAFSCEGSADPNASCTGGACRSWTATGRGDAAATTAVPAHGESADDLATASADDAAAVAARRSRPTAAADGAAAAQVGHAGSTASAGLPAVQAECGGVSPRECGIRRFRGHEGVERRPSGGSPVAGDGPLLAGRYDAGRIDRRDARVAQGPLRDPTGCRNSRCYQGVRPVHENDSGLEGLHRPVRAADREAHAVREETAR